MNFSKISIREFCNLFLLNKVLCSLHHEPNLKLLSQILGHYRSIKFIFIIFKKFYIEFPLIRNFIYYKSINFFLETLINILCRSIIIFLDRLFMVFLFELIFKLSISILKLSSCDLRALITLNTVL